MVSNASVQHFVVAEKVFNIIIFMKKKSVIYNILSQFLFLDNSSFFSFFFFLFLFGLKYSIGDVKQKIQTFLEKQQKSFEIEMKSHENWCEKENDAGSKTCCLWPRPKSLFVQICSFSSCHIHFCCFQSFLFYI